MCFFLPHYSIYPIFRKLKEKKRQINIDLAIWLSHVKKRKEKKKKKKY